MIIRRVKLHPFAGHASTEIELARGLNVLHGDNDVGKTTVFRAIEHALFTPPQLKLNTQGGKEFVRTCIPIGGDHAAVTIEFERAGASYVLSKKWGEGYGCALRLPDGVALTSPAAVQERLASLFPASEGSFRSILFAPQGSLVRTIGDLTENPGVLQNLGDLLRAAVSETGGVSVDRLKARAQAERDAVFKFWDARAGGPKDGKDIGNEWAERSQGTLLSAYYAKRRLQKQALEVEATEAEFGEKSSRLAAVQARERELAAYVVTHEPLIEADTRREGVALKAKAAEADAAAAAADFAAWTEAGAALPLLKEGVASRRARAEGLKAELARATAAASKGEFLRRYRDILAEKAVYDERAKALAAESEVKPEDLGALRLASRKIDTLRASLSGRKLRVTLRPKGGALDAVVQTDLSPESRRTLPAETALELEAGGRVRIGTDRFELTVSSGDGDMAALERNVRAEEERVRAAFARHGVKSLEELEERAARFQDAALGVRAAKAAVLKLLGGEPLDRWHARAKELESVEGARPLDLVQAEYERELDELKSVQMKERAALDQVTRLATRYSLAPAADGAARLMPVLLERERRKAETRAELEALPALPADVGDPGEYRRRFRAAREEGLRLKAEVEGLLPKIAELRARLPELSAQAYLRQLREAEAAFDRELRRGNAILRVLRVIEGLEADGGNVYERLHGDFAGFADRFSRSKYGPARMNAALPETLRRRDGTEVPFDLLSTGTKDAFALSLRLSMARHFLGEAGGVILMDDPMVSMDAGRRRIAAEVLAEFAADTQLVLFTCHDAHADALGGNRVELRGH